jgi:hypothetical protein
MTDTRTQIAALADAVEAACKQLATTHGSERWLHPLKALRRAIPKDAPADEPLTSITIAFGPDGEPVVTREAAVTAIAIWFDYKNWQRGYSTCSNNELIENMRLAIVAAIKEMAKP